MNNDLENYRGYDIIEIIERGTRGFGVHRPPEIGPGGQVKRGLSSVEAAREWIDAKYAEGKL